MQEDLQLTLFILGLIAIPAVLLHGLWKIRMSNKQSKKASYESKDWDPSFEHQDEIDDAPMYDELGVGKARVVINPSPKKQPKSEEDTVSTQAQSRSTGDLGDTNEINTTDPMLKDNQVDFEEPASAQSEPKEDMEKDELPEKEQFEELSNGVDESIYGGNVVALDKNNSAFQAKPSETHATGFNNFDAEKQVDDNSDTPVYSNVITQPKPEYNKVIYSKDHDIDTISASSNPPEFLLKKQVKSATKEDNSGSSNQSEQDSAPEVKVNIDDIPDIANDPDFALNIQDGPKSTTRNASKSNNTSQPKKPASQFSLAEQAKRFVRRNKKTVAEKIRKEPVLKSNESEDQMRIDFDNTSDAAESNNQQQAKTEQAQTDQNTNSKPVDVTDVLVLNVRAADDKPIEGAALLPMLLTLGFKFGEHDIFHRHVNTNGKGPILFSLTNMFKPGVFDIDNMETFKTYGVSLFMMLPIEGDAQQVFNMMHNAARKISDEFDCRILDSNKVGISKQSLQQYVERIREFERKRKTN